jgi:hypothetical protein
MGGPEFDVNVMNELHKIERHLAELVKVIKERLPPAPPPKA